MENKKLLTVIGAILALITFAQGEDTLTSSPAEAMIAKAKSGHDRPELLAIDGYLRPEEIAIPPEIPGYRLYQIDRDVTVAGVLQGGGSFDAILPLYVYYPNSKTINMAKELDTAIDSLNVIKAELEDWRKFTGQSGGRRLSEHMASLETSLKMLQAIQNEEIQGFSR